MNFKEKIVIKYFTFKNVLNLVLSNVRGWIKWAPEMIF